MIGASLTPPVILCGRCGLRVPTREWPIYWVFPDGSRRRVHEECHHLLQAHPACGCMICREAAAASGVTPTATPTGLALPSGVPRL